MLQDIKFDDVDKTIERTLHLSCIKIFLEAIPTRLRSSNNLTEGTRETTEVKEDLLNSLFKREITTQK